MAKEFKLSAERLEELKNELNYLKTVREKEVADLIKEARSFGDLSENSEYDEAKNEQGKLYSRIAELEDILLHVVIIEEHDADAQRRPSSAAPSPCVDVEMRAARCRPIRSSALRRPTPCTAPSPRSPPSARPFMGARQGDEVIVEAPVGNIAYTVVEDRAVSPTGYT